MKIGDKLSTVDKHFDGSSPSTNTGGEQNNPQTAVERAKASAKARVTSAKPEENTDVNNIQAQERPKSQGLTWNPNSKWAGPGRFLQVIPGVKRATEKLARAGGQYSGANYTEDKYTDAFASFYLDNFDTYADDVESAYEDYSNDDTYGLLSSIGSKVAGSASNLASKAGNLGSKMASTVSSSASKAASFAKSKMSSVASSIKKPSITAKPLTNVSPVPKQLSAPKSNLPTVVKPKTGVAQVTKPMTGGGINIQRSGSTPKVGPSASTGGGTSMSKTTGGKQLTQSMNGRTGMSEKTISQNGKVQSAQGTQVTKPQSGVAKSSQVTKPTSSAVVKKAETPKVEAPKTPTTTTSAQRTQNKSDNLRASNNIKGKTPGQAVRGIVNSKLKSTLVGAGIGASVAAANGKNPVAGAAGGAAVGFGVNRIAKQFSALDPFPIIRKSGNTSIELLRDQLLIDGYGRELSIIDLVEAGEKPKTKEYEKARKLIETHLKNKQRDGGHNLKGNREFLLKKLTNRKDERMYSSLNLLYIYCD